MSTEIQPYQGKRPIIMKTGLVHWVTDETAEKLEATLAQQQAHGFIKIRELGFTINTAEIDGVYTLEQYKEYENVKQGLWKCRYNNWHNKGKKECDCERENMKKARQAREEAERRESERPLTPEEQARANDAMLRMGEESALEGSKIFGSIYQKGNRTGRKIRKTTLDAWVEKRGPVRPEILNRLAIEGEEEAHTNEIHETFA